MATCSPQMRQNCSFLIPNASTLKLVRPKCIKIYIFSFRMCQNCDLFVPNASKLWKWTNIWGLAYCLWYSRLIIHCLGTATTGHTGKVHPHKRSLKTRMQFCIDSINRLRPWRPLGGSATNSNRTPQWSTHQHLVVVILFAEQPLSDGIH